MQRLEYRSDRIQWLLCQGLRLMRFWDGADTCLQYTCRAPSRVTCECRLCLASLSLLQRPDKMERQGWTVCHEWGTAIQEPLPRYSGIGSAASTRDRYTVGLGCLRKGWEKGAQATSPSALEPCSCAAFRARGPGVAS